MRVGLQGALAALAALLLLPAPSSAATLKIATVVPDGTQWMREMRAGAAEISERTGGRVALKFYPGGVMGTEKAVMRKIRVGQLQGGAFTPTGLGDLYRDAEIYGVPFLFHSYDEVDYVRARMDQTLRAGLERAGLVALAFSETGFAYLLSDLPLRSVDDLSSARVWVLEDDRLSQTALRIAGVSPIPLALADVYTGLQTGLIDTVAASPIASIAFQWHTKVRYLTDVPLMYLMGVLAVDAKAFGRLSQPDQDVLRDVIGGIARELDEATRASNAQAKQALRDEGIQFVTGSPEEVERWRAIADAALARVRADGLYSDEIIEAVRQHLLTHRTRSQAPAASE